MRKQILIFGHNYVTHFVDIYNQYTRLFDKRKYEVTVAYLTGEPRQDILERTLAEKVVFFNIPKKNIRTLKVGAVRKLFGLCKEKQFEMVICHRYKPSYIMMWVAQFYRIPALIYVMHELDTMSSLNRQLLIACIGRRKNMYFAGVSNAVRDDMRKSLWCIPKERVLTLYNTIDVDLMEPLLLDKTQARRALSIPEDAFVFGNLARLVPNKDQHSLIRAFAQIKSACPHAKLVIMGEGHLETKLREWVTAYGLTDNVIFTGFVAGGFRYMKAFDCFVLSSVQEAFGRVLIEAMIAKLPIIATDVHGIPEVVGKAGMIVEARKPTLLADAMKTIYQLTAKERTEWGDHAYQHVLANFSIPTFHEQFWQLPLIRSLTRESTLG